MLWEYNDSTYLRKGNVFGIGAASPKFLDSLTKVGHTLPGWDKVTKQNSKVGAPVLLYDTSYSIHFSLASLHNLPPFFHLLN